MSGTYIFILFIYWSDLLQSIDGYRRELRPEAVLCHSLFMYGPGTIRIG